MTLTPPNVTALVEQKIAALEMWIEAFDEAEAQVQAKQDALDELKAWLRRAAMHNSTVTG